MVYIPRILYNLNIQNNVIPSILECRSYKVKYRYAVHVLQAFNTHGAFI